MTILMVMMVTLMSVNFYSLIIVSYLKSDCIPTTGRCGNPAGVKRYTSCVDHENNNNIKTSTLTFSLLELDGEGGGREREFLLFFFFFFWVVVVGASQELWPSGAARSIIIR